MSYIDEKVFAELCKSGKCHSPTLRHVRLDLWFDPEERLLVDVSPLSSSTECASTASHPSDTYALMKKVKAGIVSNTTRAMVETLKRFLDASTTLFNRFGTAKDVQDLKDAYAFDQASLLLVGEPTWRSVIQHNASVSLAQICLAEQEDVNDQGDLPGLRGAPHLANEDENNDIPSTTFAKLSLATRLALPLSHCTSHSWIDTSVQHCHTLSFIILRQRGMSPAMVDLAVDLSRAAVAASLAQDDGPLSMGQQPTPIRISRKLQICEFGLMRSLYGLYEAGQRRDVECLNQAVAIASLSRMEFVFIRYMNCSNLRAELEEFMTCLLAHYESHNDVDALRLAYMISDIRPLAAVEHATLAFRMNYAISRWYYFKIHGHNEDLDGALDVVLGMLRSANNVPLLLMRQSYTLLSILLLSIPGAQDGPQLRLDAYATACVAFTASFVSVTCVEDCFCIACRCYALLQFQVGTGSAEDISTITTSSERGVNTATLGSLERSLFMASVSLGSLRQWEETRQMADLIKSVDSGRQAVSGAANLAYSGRAQWQITLARALLHLWSTDESNREPLKEAYNCIRQIVVYPTGHPPLSTRFQAATLWVKHASHHLSPTHALEAYDGYFSLLPYIRLLKPERDGMLEEAIELTASAVTCAIECGDFPLAVEFFEQGRRMLWQLTTGKNDDLERLRARDHKLVDQLSSLAWQLEFCGLQRYNLMQDSEGGYASVDSGRSLLVEQWKHLLSQVRSWDGFSDFLFPPLFDAMKDAVKHGPIVLLNSSPSRCDALIIPGPASDIISIPLDVISLNLAEAIQKLEAGVPPSRYTELSVSPERREHLENTLQSVLDELHASVVLPIMAKLKSIPGNTEWQRIWLCPSGLFTSLPIHAALYHDPQLPVHPSDRWFDGLISSYTPSLLHLLRPSQPQTQPSALSVFRFEDVTPGTSKEIDAVLSTQPRSSVKYPVSRLFGQLESCTLSAWTRVTCPTKFKSAFNECKLTPVMYSRKEAFQTVFIGLADLQDSDVAFLSAADTAIGFTSVAQETIHMAVYMAAAGFRSSVGTMWGIDDADGGRVVEDVYRYLSDHSQTRECRTLDSYVPEALHYAVGRLQESGASPLRWAPFMHVGR